MSDVASLNGHRALYQRADQLARSQHCRRMAAARPVDRSEDALIEAVIDGVMVAEELPTKTRERLWCELIALGWTDREIAEHTRTTEYTTARIRDRLGLSPNQARVEELSA